MIRRTLILIVAVLFAVAAAFSQSSQYTKDTADQSLRSNGRVNPSTLGLEMDIPLGAYPGRGINLPLSLSYSSKQWRLAEEQCGSTAQGMSQTWAVPRFSENAAAGWTTSLSQPYIEYTGEMYRFQDDGEPLRVGETGCVAEPWRANDTYMKRVTVYVSGSSHELLAQDEPVAITKGQVPAESVWNTTFYATDGSGLKYVQDPGTDTYRLYMPDGSFYDFSPTREYKSTTEFVMVRRANRIKDVHGNFVEFFLPNPSIPAELLAYPNGYWQDQLNRKFPVMVPRHNPTLPQNESVLEQSFTMPGMNDPYILKWKRLKGDGPETSALTTYSQDLHYPGAWNLGGSMASNFPALFGYEFDSSCGSSVVYAITYNPSQQHFNPVVLTDIVLPNGAAYKFTYNLFGEIEVIRYPTGGREEVDYLEVPALAELTGLYKRVNRGVVKRDVYESDSDQAADTWLYSAGVSANNYRTSVIAPDDTQTDRYMHRGVPPNCVQNPDPPMYFGTRWGHDNVLAGMQYDERVFNSAGSIVQRQVTRWAATTTTTRLNQTKYAQRNARVVTTESITYDGNAGLSAATKNEYDTDADALGSPLNVSRTTQYAFKPVADGSSFAPAVEFDAPPSAIPTLPDPTISATAVRVSDSVHLQSDPDYVLVKDHYLARNIVKLVTKVQTKTATGTTVAKSEIKYDDPSYSNPNSYDAYRGQPTSVLSWLDTTNTWIETKTKYDQYGNPIESTDAKGSITTTTYDPTYHAFPVSVTSPVPSDGAHGSNVAFTTSTTYNMVTGQAETTTDANGHVTTISYRDPITNVLDPLLRVRKVTMPNGHQTITEYGSGTDSYTRFVKTRSQIDATNWKEGYVWYDGLGRTTRSQSVDPAGDIVVDTQYDSMGRADRATNPYRLQTVWPHGAAEPVYWTESTFDTAGRPWKTTTSDGAFVETTYSIATTGGNIGTAVTVKDQAGKLRRSITNSLGHLTRVDEPASVGAETGQLGAITAPNQATFYTYDLLNNLTEVQQPGDTSDECGGTTPPCSQTRSFQYDSLSRLKQATNPESGIIQYTYDPNSNLLTKTDARGIVTSFAYDALNRVKTRQYTNEPSGSETPDVSYYYDLVTNAKGKLIKVASSVSTTEYTEFDILGRVTRSKQTTDGVEYGGGSDPNAWMTYSYNLSGAMIEQQYPSGRKVQSTIDSNGDLEMVKSRKNSNSGYWAYANNFSYNSAGAVTSLQLGNGRWESTTFNERLEPTQIALGVTPGATNLLDLDYTYGTTANNGNVLSQTITVPTVGATPGFTAVQNYSYDSLNRLKQADEKPQGWTDTNCTSDPTKCWKQTFTFDRYGNRRFDEGATTMPASFANQAETNPTISPNTNKLTSTGWSYDQSGNTKTDPSGRNFIYDAENKQTSVTNTSGTIGQYFYDGDGKRVKKVVPSTGETTIFVYDAGGKLVAEYSTIVASINNAKVAYLTNDHLGSPRINTDAAGAVMARHDYHPFGEEAVTSQRVTGVGYLDDSVRKQFTGYERDEESDLDFAQARMYYRPHGRFVTADPLYISDARLRDPQQLNLYIYTRGNPINLTDVLGLEIKATNKQVAEYERKLQERISAFQIDTTKKGKVVIVDAAGKKLNAKQLGALGATLTGTDKDLFTAITDKKNHAVIDTGDGTANPNVDFGKNTKKGHQTLDFTDIRLLDGSANAGGFTGADAVAHETFEAYKSATYKNLSDGAAQARAHSDAANAFGAIGNTISGTFSYHDDGTASVTRYTERLPVYGGAYSGKAIVMEVEAKLAPPIPVNGFQPPTAYPPANITNIRKIP